MISSPCHHDRELFPSTFRYKSPPGEDGVLDDQEAHVHVNHKKPEILHVQEKKREERLRLTIFFPISTHKLNGRRRLTNIAGPSVGVGTFSFVLRIFELSPSSPTP